MSSGRIRLSVRGLEDELISGQPQMSHFFKRFARQEPFETLFVDNSLETIVQGRTPTYGDTIRFKVPRSGDLLSKIFLKIVLPPSFLYSNLLRSKTDVFALYSIIENVDLIIGGQLVERLTGEFIMNYIKLYFSSNKLNNIEKITEMSIKDLNKTYADFGQFVLLPIPFYFYEKKGSEIPLIALTRQNVSVSIKLASKPPVTGLPELSDVTVATEYVLLGSEETKQIFQRNGLLYRVTQLQMNSVDISTSESIKTIDLDFQNPVREMFVYIQPKVYQDINNGNYYNYFGNYINSFLTYKDTTSGYYLSGHHLTGMSLKFNNNIYIDEESSGSATMMCYTLPQKYYANTDNHQQFRGYLYPFVNDPLSPHPQGHINMSRILKKQLTLHLNTSSLTRTARVYARSYNIMMIRDGVSGMMFTNPSYYNPKIVLGESSALTEGQIPTGLPPVPEGEGYYYAIKVDDGHELVGFQIYTEEDPQFPSPQDLHDNQFSYLFNTTDTFLSNVTPTDTDVYAPGTVSQLLRSVIQVPSETDSEVVDKYHVTSSNNYIFSSNFGFAATLRLAIKTNESEPLESLSLVDTTDKDLYGNLTQTANVILYSSNVFFDHTNPEAWTANATADYRLIRVNYREDGESDGYYYAAKVTKNAQGQITSYDKVHFARTYDFVYVAAVVAPSSDDYDFVANESFVTYSVTNLNGSGNIKTFVGSTQKGSTVFYNTGESEKTITFQEELERGVKIYSVLIARDGLPDITRSFRLVAGGQAPPLYHAFQLLPPEGSTDSMSILSIQAYSPPPDTTSLGTFTIETSNIVPLSNITTTYTGGALSNTAYQDVTYSFIQYRLNASNNLELQFSTGTVMNPITMGDSKFIYTENKESVTFYIAAIETTYVPDPNSRVRMLSSEIPFTPSDPGTWIAGADEKTYKLSELSNNTRVVYKQINRQTVYQEPDSYVLSNFYTTIYYIPFDTVAPVISVTYKGVLVVSGETITMERLTPLSDFIQLPPSTDETYLNIQVDDPTATIQETNTLSNTVVTNGTPYTITVTATDASFNQDSILIKVEVEDTQPPALVSNTLTGNGLELQIDIELNETANVVLKQNGVTINTWSYATGTLSNTVTGLPEGILHTYTIDTEDLYENTGTLFIGEYIPDVTKPELFLYNYSDVRIITGTTLYLTRYADFVDIDATAIDNIDGEVQVTIEGDTPDTTERHGTTTQRIYRAIDSAGNSNSAIINFVISDSVSPKLDTLNSPTVNTETNEITISGIASEECDVLFYYDSDRTRLASSTTTDSENAFTVTFSEYNEGMIQYYVRAYDGINNTDYITTPIYLSDEIYRFSYEGFSNSQVDVPIGLTNMYVFLWGANGGGDNGISMFGGGGGFTESKISNVVPTTTITVNVGEGNVFRVGDTRPFGGGGTANNISGYVFSGSGGGATNVIYNGTVTVATAGGGGGATSVNFGSGGGGLSANVINGTGGTQTAGGSGFIGVGLDYIGQDGSSFLGGNANIEALNSFSGGGGGGGYFGGGSGASDSVRTSATAGGGGSSWLGKDGSSILTHSSNEWGTTITFEDTIGRTDTSISPNLTYTNSKMLRGANGSPTKPLLSSHYFSPGVGAWQDGYAVLMFTGNEEIVSVSSPAFRYTFEDTFPNGDGDVDPGATLTSEPSLATAPTPIPQGLKCGSYIGTGTVISNFDEIDTLGYTVTFWYNHNIASIGSSSYVTIFSSQGYSATGYRFYYYGDTQFRFFTGAGYVRYDYDSADLYTEWRHFVVSIPVSGRPRLWIDNTEILPDASSTFLYSESVSYATNNTLGIGAGIGSSPLPTNGFFDDFRIYRGLFKTEHVSLLYGSYLVFRHTFEDTFPNGVGDYNPGTTLTVQPFRVEAPTPIPQGTKCGSYTGTGTVISNFTRLDTLGYTVAFWYYHDTEDTDYKLLFGTTTYLTTGGYRLYYYDNDRLIFYTQGNGIYSISFSVVQADFYEQWSHIVVNIPTSGKPRLWFNGLRLPESVTNMDDSTVITNTSGSDMEIGANTTGSGQAYATTGFFDDFRIYKGLLEPQDVKDLYNSY